MFDSIPKKGVFSYGGELKWKTRRPECKMENTLKEMRENAPVMDKESKSTVTGGVGYVYGEDSATEDQTITPWTFSVARLERFNFFPLCFDIFYALY